MAWAQTDAPVEMKLMVGETDDTPTVGLLLTPDSGWRIYAPAPRGETNQGFEPQIDNVGSLNLDHFHPVWPVSDEYRTDGLLSYVYQQKTLVPIHVTPTDPSKPTELKFKVRLLACSNLCVPVEQELSITLTPGSSEDPQVESALEKIAESYEGISLWMILLFALFGGFILNFMPCVLPVLSLKFMSFAKHKEDATTSSFLMTTLGVLFSFLILALGAIALKASGEMVGWGMHFQNPYFLTILFLVILIFAANMLGLYDFTLSGKLANEANQASTKSRFKDFFSGVFATLLATPCSAPFVGTSLSFALAHDYTDILAVFMTLGLGFASPYIIAMLIPSHRLPLPKPGLWMVWLQRILGLALVATAVWLGLVLLAHISILSLAIICMGAGLILLQLFLQHRLNFITLALFVTTLGTLPFLDREEEKTMLYPQIAEQEACMSLWCDFDEKAIPHLVDEGYTIIVDVTADWCVTCAVNKKLVFESPRITEALTQPHIISMRADWTKQSSQITEYLQKNARFGIPFNIVYGPNVPEGIPLPEILTVDLVLETLEKASLSSQ